MASLLPIALEQLQISGLSHRHRGQAPSHTEPASATQWMNTTVPMWEGACPGTDRRHPLRLKPETSFTCINHGQEVTGHVMESRIPDGPKSQIDRRLAVRRLFKTSTGIELRH